MLARQYNDYALNDESVEQERQQQLEREKQEQRLTCRVWRRRIMAVMGVVLMTYLVTVIRSEAMVQHGTALVSMQQQETSLINKTNELKIEVEQLKGPERIIGLAQKNLGMSVARSNIYVKSAVGKNNANSLAMASK